jgi:glyoxylase-like metal-dependent hydrolase (beta-lactamase superfamily II)
MTHAHTRASIEAHDVRYSWTLLRAGEFRLDGGSMFGLIPRSVWSRSVPVDEQGRITVQHNCLLLERSGDAAADVAAGFACAPKRILIEAGTGDKLDPKSKALFAMGERSILDALHEADCSPVDVGGVVVSHLHFDHAGGLTRSARDGEMAEWVGAASGMAGSRPDHGVVRTFPNAKIFTQRREWEDALANRSVMTRTYFRDHLEPVREQVVMVDGPAPHPSYHTPDRGEVPWLTLEQRLVEVMPGVCVLRTPGHTWGQQAVLFTDTSGRTVVFTPDVMPTAAHVGAAYSLAYDVEAYTSMITKQWFLTEAAARGWTLVLDHEPGDAVRRVVENGKGWFELVGAS